jgi:hypothetical protein
MLHYENGPCWEEQIAIGNRLNDLGYIIHRSGSMDNMAIWF